MARWWTSKHFVLLSVHRGMEVGVCSIPGQEIRTKNPDRGWMPQSAPPPRALPCSPTEKYLRRKASKNSPFCGLNINDFHSHVHYGIRKNVERQCSQWWDPKWNFRIYSEGLECFLKILNYQRFLIKTFFFECWRAWIQQLENMGDWISI